MPETRKTSEIVYREDLYPRNLTSPETVQTYAENLDVMPPVEINQNNILIDGWHRWTAHKKNEVENVPVKVTVTESEKEVLYLAIKRNNSHGLQLSKADKKDKAREMYHATPVKQRKEFKAQLSDIFSVTPRTITNWLSRIDKDAKVKQKKQVFDLWLSCFTQQEIADEIGIGRKTVDDQIKDFGEKGSFSESAKINFKDGFKPQIYNVWKKQSKTNTVDHFGNSESEWLENLLYMYTAPFDIVFDPFAGGGSTIDVCKKRGRRYYVSDRKPIVERENEIRKHDITSGCPAIPRWKDVKLVYLDPPYWKQAENQYSKDPEDLANMSLEDFNKNLSCLINSIAGKMQAGSHIAMIIQPTQWKSPGKKFTDHVVDIIKSVKIDVAMRVSAPYESQQCTAQMVKWAKENKTLLVLSREIVIWEV